MALTEADRNDPEFKQALMEVLTILGRPDPPCECGCSWAEHVPVRHNNDPWGVVCRNCRRCGKL